MGWSRGCVGAIGVLAGYQGGWGGCCVGAIGAIGVVLAGYVRLAFTGEIIVRPELGISAGAEIADVGPKPVKIRGAAGVDSRVVRVGTAESPADGPNKGGLVAVLLHGDEGSAGVTVCFVKKDEVRTDVFVRTRRIVLNTAITYLKRQSSKHVYLELTPGMHPVPGG